MAWSPPTTTGNAPRSTALATAAVILSKLRTTSDGTTVTLPQSAMLTPRSSFVLHVDVEETASRGLGPVGVGVGVGPGSVPDRVGPEPGAGPAEGPLIERDPDKRDIRVQLVHVGTKGRPEETPGRRPDVGPRAIGLGAGLLFWVVQILYLVALPGCAESGPSTGRWCRRRLPVRSPSRTKTRRRPGKGCRRRCRRRCPSVPWEFGPETSLGVLLRGSSWGP